METKSGAKLGAEWFHNYDHMFKGLGLLTIRVTNEAIALPTFSPSEDQGCNNETFIILRNAFILNTQKNKSPQRLDTSAAS
jgi:hypothetical protein